MSAIVCPPLIPPSLIRLRVVGPGITSPKTRTATNLHHQGRPAPVLAAGGRREDASFRDDEAVLFNFMEGKCNKFGDLSDCARRSAGGEEAEEEEDKEGKACELLASENRKPLGEVCRT